MHKLVTSRSVFANIKGGLSHRGTSGIGRAISLGLAQAGADVVSTGRRVEQVHAVAAEIEAMGRRTLRQPTDLDQRSQVKALLEACLQAFGTVDILVNAAGKIRRTPTLTMAEEDWRDIFETNLTGALRACQIFGTLMIERGGWADRQYSVP